MKAHDQFSVVFTWNVVFQNSDQFLYLTSAPSYDCGFVVLGQRYIMTIYIYIYIYIYRIGHFADKLRPEPMHCEINAWQHYIDLLYLEAVRIKKRGGTTPKDSFEGF